MGATILEEKKKAVTILSYGLFVMAITHSLTHAFQNIHTTIFPVLKEEFALSNQQLGLIAAIPSLCSALLSIPMGMLSDRVGSKKMIFLSIAVASAGALIAAATKNPFMFIVAVSLLFISLTIYHPAAYSFTTRLFEPKDRAKALGLLGAGGTFGMAIGPISISILMGTFAFGWRQVYFAWFFPLILGVIAVFFIRTEPTEDVSLSGDEARSQGQATKLFTSSLILFLVFGGLRNVGMRMTRTFLSVWLVNTKGWELTFASLVFGASSLMGILAAPLGGLFASRYGEKRWTVMTLIVSYTCFALAFLIPGTLPFVVLYLGYGFFNFLSMAANSAIMAKLSPSGQRGLGFALYFLPGSVMGAIAPMIAAWIADAYGIYTIFMCSVGILIAALTLLNFGVKVD